MNQSSYQLLTGKHGSMKELLSDRAKRDSLRSRQLSARYKGRIADLMSKCRIDFNKLSYPSRKSFVEDGRNATDRAFLNLEQEVLALIDDNDWNKKSYIRDRAL